jgi:hypothetical protein
MTFGRYVLNVAEAFDRLLNAILLGDPMQTISHRAYLARQHNQEWACLLCKVLDFFQKDHCAKAADT